MQHGSQSGFFGDLGVTITPESDAWMCLSHCKYGCFRKVPLFWFIGDWRVRRDALGLHFSGFLGTLGSNFVVWEGPGTGLEF